MLDVLILEDFSFTDTTLELESDWVKLDVKVEGGKGKDDGNESWLLSWPELKNGEDWLNGWNEDTDGCGTGQALGAGGCVSGKDEVPTKWGGIGYKWDICCKWGNNECSWLCCKGCRGWGCCMWAAVLWEEKLEKVVKSVPDMWCGKVGKWFSDKRWSDICGCKNGWDVSIVCDCSIWFWDISRCCCWDFLDGCLLLDFLLREVACWFCDTDTVGVRDTCVFGKDWDEKDIVCCFCFVSLFVNVDKICWKDEWVEFCNCLVDTWDADDNDDAFDTVDKLSEIVSVEDLLATVWGILTWGEFSILLNKWDDFVAWTSWSIKGEVWTVGFGWENKSEIEDCSECGTGVICKLWFNDWTTLEVCSAWCPDGFWIGDLG